MQQAYVTYVFVLFKPQTVQAHDSSILALSKAEGQKDDRVKVDQIETLELQNVQFAYPARPEIQVLQGISLTINKVGSTGLHLPFQKPYHNPISPAVNRLLWQCLPFYVQGQKVAFVGESGSGKSTIMALLERFYDPIAGAVLVNNQDLRRAKRKNNEIAFDILIGSDSNNEFIVIVTTNLPCKTFRDDLIASQHVPARHMEGI